MKKIFTLLLSVGIFSASFAQSNHQKNQYDRNDQYAMASNGRYNNHNDRQYDNNRNYSYEDQKALEIQKINQDYNNKVKSIENNRFIKNRQKKIAIRNTQKERDQQIQQINAQYDHKSENWGRR
ncbi:MAG: hypothetical protein ACTHOB_16095 [Ginsengibacter sp.]